MNKYIKIQALNRDNYVIASAELPVEFYNDRRMDLIAKIFERIFEKAKRQGEEKIRLIMKE